MQHDQSGRGLLSGRRVRTPYIATVELHHYKCPRPDCGRLTSKPWNAVWCLHHDSNFQPSPPSHSESDWSRMDPVVSVQTEPLPEMQWYVIEYNAEEAGWEDVRRVASEPMSELEARAEADRRSEALDAPYHLHSFEARPEDLIRESWLTDRA